MYQAEGIMRRLCEMLSIANDSTCGGGTIKYGGSSQKGTLKDAAAMHCCRTRLGRVCMKGA